MGQVTVGRRDVGLDQCAVGTLPGIRGPWGRGPRSVGRGPWGRGPRTVSRGQ